MTEKKDLTPRYFRFIIHLIRPFSNFDFSFIKPIRFKAAQLLNLKPGDRVLDMGCGPGGSFPFLLDVVGPTGEVVGVEISPEVCINAKRRVEINKWKNVHVVEADARTVSLSGSFDGVLMFAAPDVFASEKALDNILPHTRERARVVFFGAKTATKGFGKALNPIFKMLFKLSFKTTPGLENEPWQIIGKYVDHIEVEEYFFGIMFLASGTVLRKRSS